MRCVALDPADHKRQCQRTAEGLLQIVTGERLPLCHIHASEYEKGEPITYAPKLA